MVYCLLHGEISIFIYPEGQSELTTMILLCHGRSRRNLNFSLYIMLHRPGACVGFVTIGVDLGFCQFLFVRDPGASWRAEQPVWGTISVTGPAMVDCRRTFNHRRRARLAGLAFGGTTPSGADRAKISSGIHPIPLIF